MRNNHSKSKSDLNDFVNKKKSKDIKKINFNNIYDLYKSNFIDNCELILIEKQNNLLDKFFNKMKLIIKSEYEEDIFDKNKALYEITKKCEKDFISDVYWPMYDSCISLFEKFKNSKNNRSFYLSNFISHCNYEQIAIHSCGSKFIEINSKKNQTLYAGCTGCRKCYYGSCIPIYCPFSHKKYYSKIIKEEDKILVPATWEEYHCKNPIINEQMSCIKCDDKFWIKKNKLFCKNCKYEIDQLSVIWTCRICKKDFKSKAKKYNPLEYKEIENAIKEARIHKKMAKPNEIPCKCIKSYDIKNYNFSHKSNGHCKGVLYYGQLKNEDILVCSSCNSFFPINEFVWVCPVCRKTFITNNINKNNINENNIDYSNPKLKSEQSRKILMSSSNLSENSEGNPFYYNYRGTPFRESYVKKKPNDYYNYSNKNKEESLGNKKRNLSITFTNKIIENNFDNDNIIKEMNINKKIEKDSRYNTNNNFYTKYNNMKRDSNKDFNESSNYTNKNSTNNNEFYSPTKNKDIINDKRYLKIQLTTQSSKKYNKINDSKRFASTSTRNYNFYKKDNGETSMTDFKKDKNIAFNNSNQRKFEKYSHYNKIMNIKYNIINNNESINSQIYIPKRKLDLNTSHNLVNLLASPREKNGNNNNYNNNNKIYTSNSVGIRERYKRINKKINNLYEKRNLKTMYEENEENDNLNSKRNKDYSALSIIDSKNNNDNYKELRSSSQYKIEREKYKNLNLDILNNISKLSSNEEVSSVKNKVNENFNNLKHKYNKRYIGNNDNYNYSNINISKGTSKNIYRRGINILYNKEKSGTNISNGGDNIVMNNAITNNNNNNNIDKIYNKYKKINYDNINSGKREKKNYINKYKDMEIKDLKDKKYITNNDNYGDINKNIIINNNFKSRQSFKNGGNSIKEFDNIRKYNSISNEDINYSKNDELKEFNFNDYKVITQLGQGTFGKIYLVQDKNNQLFSMKKIILSEELDVQSVINEYKMCQKLKHQNVVKILGIYNNKLDSTTYVVYVLMEVGLTDWEKEIRSYNDKNLEYSEKELIQIIKQLSSVLSFLQKNKISHRDIKPQNILVFKNNVYKVADFGEAKQIDNLAKNLINYSLRGTELYMSPLLFNGLRTGQIDIKHNLFKSDVYSLGLCILYAAVTNNKPLYEIRKYVDMVGVKKYLEKLLVAKYSQKFLSLLYSMLEIHEKNRPDFIELEKIMKTWK